MVRSSLLHVYLSPPGGAGVYELSVPTFIITFCPPTVAGLAILLTLTCLFCLSTSGAGGVILLTVTYLLYLSTRCCWRVCFWLLHVYYISPTGGAGGGAAADQYCMLGSAESDDTCWVWAGWALCPAARRVHRDVSAGARLPHLLHYHRLHQGNQSQSQGHFHVSTSITLSFSRRKVEMSGMICPNVTPECSPPPPWKFATQPLQNCHLHS